MRPLNLVTAVAVVACVLHAASALPVKKPAAGTTALDAAPDAQQQLPLPQGFLLTRGVLTLSAPSEETPSKGTPQGSKVAKKGGKVAKKKAVTAPRKPPGAELREGGAPPKKKDSAENDPTNPLNPAVAATLLNNAAAAKDVTSGEVPTITMHVKGIKVLVNPKNKTDTAASSDDDAAATSVPKPKVAAKGKWPQDTSEGDYAKNGKHSKGFPKDHKKREDWKLLMGPSLLAPPNKTATKKPKAAVKAPGVPKVTAAAKKPASNKAAKKGKPGKGDTLVTARSLVTRVSATPPLAGWNSVASSAAAGKKPASGMKPAPGGGKKPAAGAKPKPAAKKKPAKASRLGEAGMKGGTNAAQAKAAQMLVGHSLFKKPAKASKLGEMAAPKPGAKPAMKPGAKPAQKPSAGVQKKPAAAVAGVVQKKATQMGTTQCQSQNQGHLCSTTHSWPGYQCTGGNCKSSNCRCHATKMASCMFTASGGIKCSTGNVVTDCGGSKVKAVVESACRRGAEGLL